MSALKTILKLQKGYSEDTKLTEKEVVEVQDIIARMQSEGKEAFRIIKYLQQWNSKLSEYWKAKRAFETEDKRINTASTVVSSRDEGDYKFKCLLSPNACPICIKKTNDGQKTFDARQINKDGWGHVPPFHPNCYCVLIPKV